MSAERLGEMSRSAFAVVGALFSVALIATGCGSGSSPPSAFHRATSTTARAYVRLVGEGVAVSPSTNLRDRRQVMVNVKGFEPTRKFFLSECETPTQVNRLGCGLQLAGQPFGLTDEKGDGSVSFTVRSSAATEPLGSVSVPCSGECVIVATSGADGIFGFAPISFAA